MIRVGLLGGTFDPIHLGHLAVAHDVMMKLDLSRILFIPDRQPALKTEREISPVVHRLAMVQLAIESNPNFEIATNDLGGAGPSYSVEIVSALKNELEAEVELFFIVGPDALMNIAMWKEPLSLAELCRIVAIDRPDSPVVNLQVLDETLPGISSKIEIVEVTQIDISSTDVRAKVKAGLPINHLVPKAVAEYIVRQNLYTS